MVMWQHVSEGDAFLDSLVLYVVWRSADRHTNNNINGDFSEAISCSLMMTELSKHVGVFETILYVLMY